MAFVLFVLVAGFFAYRAWTTRHLAITNPADQRISADELEERYGVRVRLIAVTAGGGMVDFRLKILDADKAMRLLGDPPTTPVLVAEDSDTRLSAPEGSITQDLRLENGGVLILLYPNTHGAIRPGTPVSVIIGEEHLEPILAQ